jgi:hypothetical protein
MATATGTDTSCKPNDFSAEVFEHNVKEAATDAPLCSPGSEK